jgi:hypothetical protein
MLAATASVGPVSWLLQLGAHTMRSASSAGEPSFIFSLVDEKNPELFYCVVMRKGGWFGLFCGAVCLQAAKYDHSCCRQCDPRRRPAWTSDGAGCRQGVMVCGAWAHLSQPVHAEPMEYAPSFRPFRSPAPIRTVKRPSHHTQHACLLHFIFTIK